MGAVGRFCRRWGGGRNVIRTHPVLAEGDLVGPRLRADGTGRARRGATVESERAEEVVLPVLDDRGQVLDAQFRRLFGTHP